MEQPEPSRGAEPSHQSSDGLTDPRSLLHRGLHFFVGNIAAGAVGLISMPVFTRLLTPEDYGDVNAYLAGAAVLTTLLTLNSSDSISRYFYERTADFREYLGSILMLCLGLLALASTGVVLFGSGLAQMTGIPRSLVYFLPAATLSYVATSCYNQVLVARGSSREVAVLRIAQGYAGLAISAGLVWWAVQSRALWRVAGLEAAGLLMCCYLGTRLVAMARPGRRWWRHLRYSFNYSIPRMPYVLSANILSSFDRLMIQSLSGAARTGIYSVGYNLSNLVLVAVQALTLAFMPSYYTLMNEGRYDEIDRQNLIIVKLLVVIAAAVVTFAGALLFLLAEARFHEARGVIAPVVVGNTLFAVAQVYHRVISYAKRTVLLSISALAAGALNIVLNALLIPRFGFVAAAYTTAGSYLLLATFSFTLARRFCRLHLTSPRLLWRPMALLLAVVLLETLVIEGLPLGWPIRAAIRLAMVVGLFQILLVRDDGTGTSISYQELGRRLLSVVRRVGGVSADGESRR